MDYGSLPGRYPALVRSYDPDRRTCRIEILGLTDGGDVMPEAEIEYPVGDKSRQGFCATEIEILPGDAVWVSFIGGDPRYPVLTGYRNPQTGNSNGWRRWHHANIELLADQVMNHIAGGDILLKSGSRVTVQAPSITLDAPQTTCTGKLTVKGLLTYTSGMAGSGNSGSGAAASISGTVNATAVTAGSVTAGACYCGSGGASETNPAPGGTLDGGTF